MRTNNEQEPAGLWWFWSKSRAAAPLLALCVVCGCCVSAAVCDGVGSFLRIIVNTVYPSFGSGKCQISRDAQLIEKLTASLFMFHK
jgi:hypothetical protein